ncbi:Hypothetical_protein [Hexamita inflata]|uniref:Hypothetical_protein n=1 Tax=Hexamita inflata TaxID=28002 RepID=A0AA86V6K4_9EUKA|nr:Hypothetical protein HINF_LOCUS66076 [Hexamita inflata]
MKNEWNHPIIAIRASVFENLALERVAYICFDSERDVKDIFCVTLYQVSPICRMRVGYHGLCRPLARVTMMVYLGQDTVPMQSWRTVLIPAFNNELKPKLNHITNPERIMFHGYHKLGMVFILH